MMSNPIANKHVKLKPSVTHEEFDIAAFGEYGNDLDYLEYKSKIFTVDKKIDKSMNAYLVYDSEGWGVWFRQDQIEAMFDIVEE